MLFDFIDRHSSRRQYHAYPDASQPLAFFDGSVRVKATKESSLGANPNAPPSSHTDLQLFYSPDPFVDDPPTRTGQPQQLLTAVYTWTRGGLGGVDFSGSK
jgi:hypothetical protein